MGAAVADALGLNRSPSAIFQQFWKDYGFVEVDDGFTGSVQSMFSIPENRRAAQGFWQKKFTANMQQKAGTIGTPDIGSAIPLIYDPEVLDILRKDAPLVARVPYVGYEGQTVRVHNISAREKPIGFISEADSYNLLGKGKKFSLTPFNVNMEIYADVVAVGDFAERASAGSFALRDTAIGARIAEHAQYKEQAFLYGDPTQGLIDGSPGDSNAYAGAAKYFTDAGNMVNKATTFSASGERPYVRDIRNELTKLWQTRAVSPADTEIWVSHTMFGILEDEMEVKAIVDQNERSVNYGFEVLTISGVPVIRSHNIRKHTWTDTATTPKTYTVGSEGDVFIQNRRAMRFAALAPLFMLPLARQGFADEIALGEYGTYIDRAKGQFGRYLKGYPVT